MQLSSQNAPVYYKVPISSVYSDGYPSDPTSDTVSFAFIAPYTWPDSGTTWYTGDWDNPGLGPPYVARILLGSGGTYNPPIGTYRVFVQIAASPENVVLPVPDNLGWN